MIDTLAKTKKSNLPEVHPGDVVRVHQKIKEGVKERIQVFEGIIIKTHGKVGPNATFTVRKIASGVGVERTYQLQSPLITKIEFKKGSKVNRAKLYYLRNLSGKALKMKEKKIDKTLWELVAKTDSEEATEEHIEEAIQAAAQKEDEQVTGASEEAEQDKVDEVKAEVVNQSDDDTVKEGDQESEKDDSKAQS
ncbi:50S ribosomal protein L19 [Patescibacteria group bacterium]|nr:50S ribosomal protein L19 [Patescibacteria group bacterium]